MKERRVPRAILMKKLSTKEAILKVYPNLDSKFAATNPPSFSKSGLVYFGMSSLSIISSSLTSSYNFLLTIPFKFLLASSLICS